MTDPIPAAAPAPPSGRHPAGLRTLFFTEMWERLSYYGMRALLVLFMVDEVRHGGLGLTDSVATAIYGLYTAGVYLAALPGGWIADRLLGAQRAILLGGTLIAAGHFCLGVPMSRLFLPGLLLVVAGTGLLKPNISALVGRLYPPGSTRRDAGFTIFYMGINLGAAIGPLICSTLGEKVNWHYGFAAAGVGMVLGLIQFTLARGRLGGIGLAPEGRSATPKKDLTIAGVALGAGLFALAPILAGAVTPDPVKLAHAATFVIAAVAAAWFAWTFFFAGLDAAERRRIGVIGVLFVASALFWSGFEQAGSSLTLFAERYTVREVPSLGLTVPTGWFQSLNPVLIISLAPAMAALWVALARRGRDPSWPVKMAWGLLLLALGFLVVAIGARRALAGGPVWPTWLIATYLLHTIGELCLSPIGLSSVTRLAPARLGGQVVGVWFLATSIGNLIASLLAGGDPAAMPARFMQVVLIAGGAGLLLWLLARPIGRLAGLAQRG